MKLKDPLDWNGLDISMRVGAQSTVDPKTCKHEPKEIHPDTWWCSECEYPLCLLETND
jgi:hypothetical protein